MTKQKRIAAYLRRNRHGYWCLAIYRDLWVVIEDGKEVAGAGSPVLAVTLAADYWWWPQFERGLVAFWPFVIEF